MSFFHEVLWWKSVATLCCLTLGCARTEPTSLPIVIFAAASTIDALDEAKVIFEREAACAVRVNYAGTPALARQVVAGADAQLFLSASERWAKDLEERGLVAERRDWLGNRLVVVVPSDASLIPLRLEDLANDTFAHLALADPDSVPAGQYARQALEKLGLWSRVSNKVVGRGDVREALALVERGEAEAGIVYATDAAASKRVRVALPIDASLHEPIRYPLLLLKPAAENALAGRCYTWLLGPAARTVFEKHGFTVLPGNSP